MTSQAIIDCLKHNFAFLYQVRDTAWDKHYNNSNNLSIADMFLWVEEAIKMENIDFEPFWGCWLLTILRSAIWFTSTSESDPYGTY